jgi:oligopeptide/dipeptide ABC transporter ATP-binding protein
VGRLPEELLSVNHLKTYFFTWSGVVRAVEDVSLYVDRGEVLGLVGESGSGKTVTALSIMGIVPPPGKIVEGKISFEGEDLLAKPEREMRGIRGNRIGYIFQDPSTSLDPVYTVGQQLAEVIMRHQAYTKRDALARALELLQLVGMPAPELQINQYPHQLSGGMKQRIAVARAICCNPTLLIADEPTTALDVTIQAQILEMMKDLIKRLGMSMILITHDMGIVAENCDRVTVLYAGQVFESGTADQVFWNPKHPYTEALLTSVPNPTLVQKRLDVIPGNIPDLIHPPTGCRFNPRCKYAQQVCIDQIPDFELQEPGHRAACHFAKELHLKSPVREAS